MGKNYNTHQTKNKKLTFKMFTFEPENMFSMVNTMMNDPEFKKLAQNIEDQMKNTMDEMKKAKTTKAKKLPKIPVLHLLLKPLKNRVLLLPKHKIVLKPKIRPPAQCFHPECAIQ